MTTTTATRNMAVGVFADRAKAEQAIAELQRVGFSSRQIGIIAPQAGEAGADEGRNETSHNMSVGAGIGMLAGASLACLITGGAISPLLGPVFLGGWMTELLSGGITGGLIGAMIGMGVPEEEAQHYQGGLLAGRTLVTVKADSRYEEAQAVLHRFGAYDPPSEPNATPQ